MALSLGQCVAEDYDKDAAKMTKDACLVVFFFVFIMYNLAHFASHFFNGHKEAQKQKLAAACGNFVTDLNTKFFWMFLFAMPLSLNAPDGFTVCWFFIFGIAAPALNLFGHLKDKQPLVLVSFLLQFVSAILIALSVMINNWCRWWLFRGYN